MNFLTGALLDNLSDEGQGGLLLEAPSDRRAAPERVVEAGVTGAVDGAGAVGEGC